MGMGGPVEAVSFCVRRWRLAVSNVPTLGVQIAELGGSVLSYLGANCWVREVKESAVPDINEISKF